MRRYSAVLLLFIWLVTGSCSRYYYRPTGVSAPLLTSKGDVHGSFSHISDDDGVNCSYLELAYSPVKHLGLSAGYNSFNHVVGSPDYSSGNVSAQGHMTDVAAGYYYAMGHKIKLVGDIYGGYSGGRISSDVTMNIHRWYLMPGIGVTSKCVELAYNFRLSGVSFSNFDANGYDDYYLASQNLINNGRRIDQGSYLFGDQSLTLRGGYKWVKIQFQSVATNAISGVPWNYKKTSFNIGLSCTIHKLLRKQK